MTLTVVLAVVIYVYSADATVTAADRALTAMPQTSTSRIERPDFHGVTLLRF